MIFYFYGILNFCLCPCSKNPDIDDARGKHFFIVQFYNYLGPTSLHVA